MRLSFRLNSIVMKENLNKILEDYNEAFRDLVNGKAMRHLGNVQFTEYIKRALKLNDSADWNFLCTAMDIIDDASLAVDHFLRFGLDGSTRYDEFGEKYLRLYGLLSAIYIQQQAILKLYRICQVPGVKRKKHEFDELEIRDMRHKLCAHGIDFRFDKKREESFVPVRGSLGGYSCSYVNNSDTSFYDVDLKKALKEHLELLVDTYDEIYTKLSKTLYGNNKDKYDEVMKRIEVPRLKQAGKSVITLPDGTVVISAI